MKRKQFGWLIIFLATLLPSAAFGQSQAEAIIDRLIESVGGIKAWQELKDVTYRETFSRLGPSGWKDEAVRTMYFMRNPGPAGDNFFRIEQEGGTIEMRYPKEPPILIEQVPLAGKAVLGFDGTEGWLTFDGKLQTDARLIFGARFVTQAFMYWFSVPFKLKDPGVKLNYQGLQQVEGKPVHVIGVSFGKGVGDNPTIRFIYHINRDKYSMEKMIYWHRGRDRPREKIFSNYVKVGGVLVPTEFLATSFDGRKAKRTWEILAVNSGLSPSFFRAPPSYATR